MAGPSLASKKALIKGNDGRYVGFFAMSLTWVIIVSFGLRSEEGMAVVLKKGEVG